jgi:tight adherence protein B
MLLPLILIGGVAMLMIMGAGIALISGSRSSVDDRLEEFVGTNEILDFEPETSIREERVADRIDRSLANRGFFNKIKSRMAKADLKLRVSEYIGLQLLSAIGFGLAGYFLAGNNIPLAIVGAFFGLFVPGLYVNYAAKKRMRAFDNQLSDTLNLWVNALRSGYSVLQGMEAIATELPPPVSVEFERVVQEVRLGLSVSQALGNMLRRVPSEDLDLVVTAVNIQREVGGNLAEILEIISHTVRERIKLKGEIRVLTAQGRVTGYIIGGLPVVLLAFLMLINRDYVGLLFTNRLCGWPMLGCGAGMIAMGTAVIQKIVDIEI